jgi:hypothetical protein
MFVSTYITFYFLLQDILEELYSYIHTPIELVSGNKM